MSLEKNLISCHNRAVFGMGVALGNHWELIKEKFNPGFIIDNDSSKWGSIHKQTGLRCISLSESKDTEELSVLITVGDPYDIESIRDQLEYVGIESFALTEILDEWCEGRPLPDYLQELKKDRGEGRILLFNTPSHDNVGDHIIAMSELDFLQARLNRDKKVYEVTDVEYLWYHKSIKKLTDSTDVILISGGGFLGSLWLYNGEVNVRNIIEEYPDNRIIILPQTIYFEDNKRGKAEFEKSRLVYNSHKNLTIIAREEETYKQIRDFLNEGDRVKLLPDMALFYKKSKESMAKQREKYALICLRRDKEGLISNEMKASIEDSLKIRGLDNKLISMHSGYLSGAEGRMRQIDDKLKEISSATLVITDTLHCMISAALTGTTCIALNNRSHKVGNVYKWIRELDYIFFCDDIDYFEVVLEKAVRRMNSKDNYFQLADMEKYEDQLEDLIRG